MQRIKDLLREWAAWSEERAQGGYPKQCAFATERVQTSNRSTDSYHDQAPEDVIKVDKEIEKLAPGFKRIVALEYMDRRPQRVKAAVLKIQQCVFSQRLAWIHEQLDYAVFGEGR